MFCVKYLVDGIAGERTAGPYTAEEVESHRKDIAGYEYVLYAITVPVVEDVTSQFERAFND